MLKFLKRSIIGLLAAAAGTVGLGHLSSQLIKAIAPTPEEFALAERGQAYGAKATAVLKSHDDLFVMKPNSFAFKAYKYTHPIFAVGHSYAKPASAFAWTSRQLFRWLGEANFVLIDGVNKTIAIEGLAPEETKISRDLAFSSIFFHELGHHHQHKKLGDSLLDIPKLDTELYGDSYQIAALSEEFNGKSRQYTLSMRAFTLFNGIHDTFPYLSKDASFPPKPIDERKRQQYAESSVALSSSLIECLTPTQIQESVKSLESNSRAMPSGLYQAFYNCLKPHEPLLAQKAEDFNPADRAVHFMQAYEYLLGVK